MQWSEIIGFAVGNQQDKFSTPFLVSRILWVLSGREGVEKRRAKQYRSLLNLIDTINSENGLVQADKVRFGVQWREAGIDRNFEGFTDSELVSMILEILGKCTSPFWILEDFKEVVDAFLG